MPVGHLHARGRILRGDGDGSDARQRLLVLRPIGTLDVVLLLPMRIGADHHKVIAGFYAAMTGTRRQHQHIPRFDTQRLPRFAAKGDLGMPLATPRTSWALG